VRSGRKNRAKTNRELSGRVEKIFFDSHGNHGIPKVCRSLLQSGEIVNHRSVRRIMKERGLIGKVDRLYRRISAPERPCIMSPSLRFGEPAPTTINQ
jgi:hypothetical protein